MPDTKAQHPQGGLKAWLTSDTPTSRLQARAVQVYLASLDFVRNPLTVTGLAIVLGLLLVALFAPFIATHDPFAQVLDDRLLPPGEKGYIFGTDELGRDIFSRIVYGSRITLMIVAIIAVIAPTVGLIVGTLAGYLGGWVDVVLMRITDIFLAFPRLVLALAFVAVLPRGVENAILAIAITSWSPYARIARAETLTVRRADYIAAIQIQGASSFRIIRGHIVPMCLSSVIIRMTLDMAGVILIAAGLGFLGLGAPPPTPEWGAMVSAGRKVLLDHWWVATLPGLAIGIVSLAFNLLGDGLRDLLDPRSGG
ncbi:ABC transporter permease [Limibacillus sp. MBR-115]|jgi:peptide/nickel transport system permease protein|uniref:ABC transporter permease n=1 Tax=Limibacillus sp. MBR-115 TaxID=3156465 RepID=UPI00339B69E9